MTISEFYSHKAIIEGFGKGRTYKVISELRSAFPALLGKAEKTKYGEFPVYNKPINNYYAAWLVFILCNCRSHNPEDVRNAVKRGEDLQSDNDGLFIFYLGELLADPSEIEHIKCIHIFYDEDNMASVFTEPAGKYKGKIKIFQGDGKVMTIRKSCVLEKDFLLELSSLVANVDDSPNYIFGDTLRLNGQKVEEIYLTEEDVFSGNPFGYLRENSNEVVNKKGKIIAVINDSFLTKK